MRPVNVIMVLVLLCSLSLSQAKSDTIALQSLTDTLQKVDLEARADSLHIELDPAPVGDYSDINRWFFNSQRKIEDELYPNDQIKLKYVYHHPCDLSQYKAFDYGRYGFGVYYAFPFNIVYGKLAYKMPAAMGSKWWLSPFFVMGKTLGDIYTIFPESIQQQVDWMMGAGFEVSNRFRDNMELLLGIQLQSVFTESKTAADNDHVGVGVPLYVGLRWYPWPDYFGVEGQVGIMPIWQMDVVNTNTTYLSAGIMTFPFKFRRDGKTAVMPLETSLLYSVPLQTVDAKIGLPIRLSRASSVALNGYLGTGTYRTGASDDVTSFRGVGLEYRFFADFLHKLINPYFGLGFGYLDFKGGSNTARSTFITAGNKSRLLQNLYLDLYYSPLVLWNKTAWPIDVLTGDDMPDFPINDFGAGLAYHFNLPPRTTGQIKVVQDAQLKQMLEDESFRAAVSSANGPIPATKNAGDYCETRVFSYTPAIECERMAFRDVTDIKFFKVDLTIGIGVYKEHDIPFDDAPKDQKDQTLLIAIFDRDRVDVKAIKDTNMYLHFSDMHSGRYFGYRWDQNGRMQPEFRPRRELNCYDKSRKLYFGHYQDFVKPMKWLENEEEFVNFASIMVREQNLAKWIFDKLASENQRPENSNRTSEYTRLVKGDILRILLEDYAIAYAHYHKDVIDSLQGVCNDFGVSIMFRIDTNDDFHADDPMGGHFYSYDQIIAKGDTILEPVNEQDLRNVEYISTDFADAAFFSNTILGTGIEELGDERGYEQEGNMIKLSGFDLNVYELSTDQEGFVKQVFRNWKKPVSRIRVEGFTDATKFQTDNEKKQQVLSERRAESIKQFLTKLDVIDPDIPIYTEGKGVYPGAQEHHPPSRCAQIYIE